MKHWFVSKIGALFAGAYLLLSFLALLYGSLCMMPSFGTLCPKDFDWSSGAFMAVFPWIDFLMRNFPGRINILLHDTQSFIGIWFGLLVFSALLFYVLGWLAEKMVEKFSHKS